MSLVEVSRDAGNPPRYILKENESPNLSEEINYSTQKTYRNSYHLTCNFAGGNQRKLRFSSANEFKFSENKTEIMVNAKGNISFDVFFIPNTTGDKNFQLIIEGATHRQPPICILARKLKVEDERPLESLILIGSIENKLPKFMALNEKQKIIFVFENRGNREVTNVNIIIKSKLQN